MKRFRMTLYETLTISLNVQAKDEATARDAVAHMASNNHWPPGIKVDSVRQLDSQEIAFEPWQQEMMSGDRNEERK